MKKNLNIFIIQFLFLFFIFLIWELFYKNFIVPVPSEFFLALIGLLSLESTWLNIFISIYRVYISILIAVFLGIFIGSIGYFNKTVFYLFQAIFYPFQYISSAILSILVIVFLGLSPLNSFIIIIIVILPNIYIATQNGLKNINFNILNWAKSYTKNKLKLFVKIIFPQILPFIQISVIRSHAISWKIIVVAEIFIGLDGVGGMINFFYRSLQFDKLFAMALLVIIIGLIADNIINKKIIEKLGVKYKNVKDK